jgi:ATP synthase protein I
VQATLADTAGVVPPESDSAPQAVAVPQGDTPQAVDPLADYIRLQRRLMVATVCLSAAAVVLTWALYGGATARSLLLGAGCGLLYLRLLARSVSRLGPDSRSLGRLQLLVPCLLVIASSRIPALQLLPALIGFVLYKPALLLQAFLAP